MNCEMGNPGIDGFNDNNGDGSAMDEDEGGMVAPMMDKFQKASTTHLNTGPSHGKVPVLTSFALKDKLKMSTWDAWSAFTRHSPYSCPPLSASGASSKSNHSHISSESPTKKPLSDGYDIISKKLEELDKENKKLELQHEVNTQWANAELSFY
ncbi:hypothetical protein V8B97DRAFT_1919192 [Scleroderma yunnanense]